MLAYCTKSPEVTISMYVCGGEAYNVLVFLRRNCCRCSNYGVLGRGELVGGGGVWVVESVEG